MYTCKSCNFFTDSPYKYMQHYRVHSNMNTIPCGVAGCSRCFRKLSAFYSHLYRDHGILRQRLRASYLQNVGVTSQCQICLKSFPFNDLVKHLKGHLTANTSINCPVSGCGRKMNKKSTFSAHLSVKHGCVNRLNVVNSHVVHSSPVDHGADSYPDSVDDENTEINSTVESSYQETAVVDVIQSDAAVKNIALFLLKLQCQYHVPVSTVEIIGREMYNLHQLSAESTIAILKRSLVTDGFQSNKVEQVISDIQQRDAFEIAFNGSNGILRSHHTRKSFFVHSLRYVEPRQLSLGYNKCNKARFIHYVPLAETLKSLLLDPSVLQCINSFPSSNRSDVFEDINDGSVCKNILGSVATSATSRYLQLIIYQDAFSIVNPLGSAKKSYKILAFYLALGNIPSHLRMKIENLQLVMLCYEKDCYQFSQDKLFHAFLADLKFLEDNGITVNNQHWNVRLISVLGDNLGSHWIGGFSTNFNKNVCPCRYCLVIKKPNCVDSLSFTAEIRTPENYNADVDAASNSTFSHGVAQQSVLNVLKFFHVCLPGLPPCLGHDLFEGIIQFDLALMLKKLCPNNSIVTVDHLNRAIQLFKFAGSDARDKPGVISGGETIGGHAVQNWCLLRLMPLLLFGVVDTTSDAWKLLLLLREIVELVCAPKISLSQVLYLNHLVWLYVEERLHLFPNVSLRPKHHYLLHYPWLITMFGPLIHVWTMRMESKHTFFKRCVRSTHNFINVTKTLSETHQMNQAYLSSGFRICDDVELGQDSVVFDSTLFADSVVTAISVYQNFLHPIHCSSRVTGKGTEYRKESFVLLDRLESQMVFGRIILCLLDSSGRGGLVVVACKPATRCDFGAYAVEDVETAELKCVGLDELWDYSPLPGYKVNGIPHVVLKHAAFDSCCNGNIGGQ